MTAWFSFYPNDWLAGTRGMSAVETGVYITLIASMYDHGAPLANDTARLSRICGATPRQFARALEMLVRTGKIIDTPEGLWNERVGEEKQKSDARICKAKSMAVKRHSGKTQENQSPNFAQALPEQAASNAIHNHNHNYIEPLAAKPVTSSQAAPREEWDQLETKLRQAAGWENEPHPNLCVVGPIAALIEAGYSLDWDILPVIKARAKRASAKGWAYFIDPIRDAHAKRMEARAPPGKGPAPKKITPERLAELKAKHPNIRWDA